MKPTKENLENYKLKSETRGFWRPGSLTWILAHFGEWLRGSCILRYFYFKLCWPFCSAEQNSLCNFGRGIIRNISLNYFKFGPVVQQVMLLKTLLAKKKLFVAFPWVETSTGPERFMICAFII